VTAAQPDLYLVNRGALGEACALELARRCRQRPGAPLAVQLDLSGAGFDKQLKRARRSGARWALVLGDEEAGADQVRLLPLDAEAGSGDRVLSREAFLALPPHELKRLG
jgi:histidyl-tRNA synthetase